MISLRSKLEEFSMGVIPVSGLSHRGEKRQETLLLRGYSSKSRLRFSAWRVHSAPWEVIMYVKATAKYTRTLIQYYYFS